MFYESVYYNKDEFELSATNTDNADLMIPIPFFFTKDSWSKFAFNSYTPHCWK